MTRMLSYILGAVMTIAGLLGFAMQGDVLGVFMAGTALSSLWVVAGVVTLVIALWMPQHAMLWAKAIGIILAVLAVLGFVISGPVVGYFDNTLANDVLHLVLAAVFLAAGFMPMGSSMESMAQPMQSSM